MLSDAGLTPSVVAVVSIPIRGNDVYGKRLVLISASFFLSCFVGISEKLLFY